MFIHAYNARHELTTAKTESKISGTYQELVGRKHAFTYDEQGNRKTHSRNSHTTTYTTNNLNQYTARTNHGHLLVEGTSSNATVKVYETDASEETATRKNDYYFRDWDPDTTSTASDYPEINIKEGTTVSATKNAWIPAVSESPTYDANGNLTGDALWSYTYDEDGARQRVDGAPQSGVPGAKRRVRKAGAPWATDEQNRLITMVETSASATAGFPDTTITFKYDYLGRRVEKKVVRGTVTESHLRFVWRGWLLVAELNAATNNARVKTYTWGPDISGSFGGAGGNGGVLIFKDHTSTVNESFYPAYGAQGNVTGLIDTSGNLDAAYEYDPFGKLIRYAGTRSTSMSLLYGTKYTDMESGLIYYGHRYYDPRQGRFINRDPIGEEGGLNLYRFLGNSPVNGVDYLGLCESEGDVDEYGNEICHDEYVLSPFTIDGDPTFADLNIWAIQDYNTEILMEQLSSTDLNSPNNVDTGNGAPANNVGPKKKVKPNKEEELPPCSEIRAKIDSGELKPTLTGQSFIEQPTVWGFLGDDRGFLDSPASFDSEDYRIHGSISYGDPEPEIGAGRSTFSINVGFDKAVQVSRLARPTGGGNVTRSGYEYEFNLNVSASDGLFFEFPLVPNAILDTSVGVDFETGTYLGVVTHTGYPATQVFLNENPIYNYSSDQAGKGPFDLGESNKETHIVAGKACDPSK